MRSRRRSGRLLPAFLAASTLLVLAAPADAAPPTVDVIVVLEDGYAPGGHGRNQARAERVAREHGVTPTQAYGTALFGFSASVPRGRLAGLENDRRVSHVEHDRAVRAFQSEELPWGVSRVGAPLGDNTGAGVHVYVLDTGIDADHPDLEGNLGNGHAVEDCKGGGCRTSWDDDQGHGTHVAGTIGAIDNDIDVVGVAPDVTLHAVKVLNKRGSGSWSGVIAGVDWVAKETASRGAATVANMSLGGGGSKSGTCTADGFTGSGSLHQAICNARNDGVVFAVAAGNDGEDAAGSVPGAYDDAVITVSATSRDDTWPSWSNHGDDVAGWTTNDSAPVALAAPGAGVLSTTVGGGTGTKSGTSMASPHVAGAAALHLAASGDQVADGSAFTDTRAALVDGAELADLLDDQGAHTEDLLDVSSLGTASEPETPTNSAPTAAFTYSCTDLACDFDGSGSSDADGSISSYDWTFGDGAATGATPSHTYDSAGTYTVTLTVTDEDGATGDTSQDVVVSSDTPSTPGVSPSLAGTSVNNGRTWAAIVTVTLEDGDGDPVDGVEVRGEWGGPVNRSDSCTSGSNGTCEVTVSGIRKFESSVTFTSVSVGHTEWDGSTPSIVVAKP